MRPIRGYFLDYFAALTAFVEAANGNNFSRAAERLGIKASTVSRYIKDLEQDLGIALFNRSTRTLHLTEGGETFLHHARKVLSELDQAKAATSALNQHPRGVLKLNVPPAFARHHLLPILGHFLERYPQIKVDLVLEDAQVNLINAGVDLAIRIGVLPDSSLKARRIAQEQLLLCVSPDFAACHGAPLSPSQLCDYPAILSAHQPDEITLISTQEQLEVPLCGRLRINDLEAQLLAVENGLGLALLPNWLVAESVREGRLVCWMDGWRVQRAGPTSALWFIYPPKRIVSSKVRCFIDFMVERIGDPPYWQH
jgi:DNA-binding transcriptional LysR family regulator